jgi:hypothetical protein
MCADPDTITIGKTTLLYRAMSKQIMISIHVQIPMKCFLKINININLVHDIFFLLLTDW